MGFDVRLRFWAFCQFVYGLVAPRLDRQEQAIRREIRKDPVIAELDDDDPLERIARRDLLRQAVLRGHLARRCFDSLWKDFRTLGDPETLANDEWLVQLARTQLLRHIEHGRGYSGFLRGYLRAQIAHLAACAPCRAKVCAHVREDVKLAAWIRDLSKNGSGDPPPDRDAN